MSEQQNTRVVQQVYQAFGAGDVRALLNLLAADVEWRLPEMTHVPFAGTWQGHPGVEKFLGTLARTQDVVEFKPTQFVSQGDTVIVLGHFAMRVKSTGRMSSSDWAHVWTIADGKVRRFREYVDTAVVSNAHTAARA
jgi:uncharacterized protein